MEVNPLEKVKNNIIWVVAVASIFVVVVIYTILIKMFRLNFIYLILEDPTGFLLSTLLIFIAETMKIFRLRFIFNKLKVKVSLKTLFLSRFMGDFMGLITVSNIGSEPTRIATIVSLEGIPIQIAISSGLLETFYDSIILTAIAFVGSIVFFPTSILVLISTLITISLWLFIFLGFVLKENILVKIVGKLFKKRLTPKIFDIFLEKYKDFRDLVKKGISSEINKGAILYTIFIIIIYVFSFLVLDPSYDLSLINVINGLFAYSMSYSVQLYPTPGGSGFFEYALIISNGVANAMIWRLSYIFVSIIPAAFSMVFFVKLRSIFKENFKRSLEYV
ncbi:MAG TPA: flippase-like domain-containing protein [Fervidicoccus fontis]|uniref:Flippase-like domain-containing protein n=1 Tax=Fervidicoccus fontis TaxID=683846 RepID=A0A2J6N2H9_9CREN|nr:MAG: hypothetical protein C0188_02710 [Fervidicoccus fontis]HEW64500.1 flippase-like domain-containing protein [Fervidicoccus fontis]